MVKKLLKYEAISYWSQMRPIYALMLVMGLILRLVSLVESESNLYTMLYGVTIFSYVMILLVGAVCSLTVSAKRYHTNLFSAEGYLTLTLPVKPSSHIIAKVMGAVLNIILTMAVIFLSVMVASFGELAYRIVELILYIISYALGGHGIASWLLLLEVIIFVIVGIAYNMLLIYACDSVGQLAKKGRVTKAFFAYIIYCIISQVIGVLAILGINSDGAIGFVRGVSKIMEESPHLFLHICMISGIVFIGGISVALFFVSHSILKNKVNLE